LKAIKHILDGHLLPDAGTPPASLSAPITTADEKGTLKESRIELNIIRYAYSTTPHNKVTTTLTRHSGDNRNPEKLPGYRLSPV